MTSRKLMFAESRYHLKIARNVESGVLLAGSMGSSELVNYHRKFAPSGVPRLIPSGQQVV